MSEFLSGLFSPMFDDKARIAPEIDVDRSTIQGESTAIPLFSDILLFGGNFFRMQPSFQHQLNPLQLVASEPAERHGPCWTLLQLSPEQEKLAVRQELPVETLTFTFRDTQITGPFLRVALPTREELQRQIEAMPSSEREALAVRLGVPPEALPSRLPHQGRGGLILASAAHVYTGTPLDTASASFIENLFFAFEDWRDTGEGREILDQAANHFNMSLSQLELTVSRIRQGHILQDEYLENALGDSSGGREKNKEDSSGEKEDEEGPSLFPRPTPTPLPQWFEVFSSFGRFKEAWNANSAPSASALREALPLKVSRKIQWPQKVTGLQEMWRLASEALNQLSLWEAERFRAWEERCSSGWEALGMFVSGISDEADHDTETDEDLASAYFVSDAPTVRARGGILSEPIPEPEEEVLLGTLSLRYSGSVTTPRDQAVFLGSEGVAVSEIPWTSSSRVADSGSFERYRGHPLARHLDAILQLACQPRDPVSIGLTPPTFDVKRVTFTELLYGRHPGFQAAQHTRVQLRLLDTEIARLQKVIPHVSNLADVSFYKNELKSRIEHRKACLAIFEQEMILEAQCAADCAAGIKTLNTVVDYSLRVANNGSFQKVKAYLVNPVYVWDSTTSTAKLVRGEYWVPQEEFTDEDVAKAPHRRILVHAYPISVETGFSVPLWYRKNGHIELRPGAENDPLFIKYGPEGTDPTPTVLFRSRLEAEVERLGFRKVPVLGDDYQISWRYVSEVFPIACRWAQAVSADWHDGVENLTEVDDEFAEINRGRPDRPGRPILTRVVLKRPNSRVAEAVDAILDPNSTEPFQVRDEGVPDEVEFCTDRTNLFLGLWTELADFQSQALDIALGVNEDRYLRKLIQEMTYGYSRISENPRWGLARYDNEPSFKDRLFGRGGEFDRAFAALREKPVLPQIFPKRQPSQDLFWQVFGYLGSDRPFSHLGVMIADRLCHANPGLAGYRMTDKGKIWQKAGAFEAWRFNEGPLGKLRTAIFAACYPKPALQFLMPTVEAIEQFGIDEATRMHVREQVALFFGHPNENVARRIVGLLSLPTYRKVDTLKTLIELNELLQTDRFPLSDFEIGLRQVWTEVADSRGTILTSLFSDNAQEVYGLRLGALLRDFCSSPPRRRHPDFGRLSFCDPYVRTGSERLL